MSDGRAAGGRAASGTARDSWPCAAPHDGSALINVLTIRPGAPWAAGRPSVTPSHAACQGARTRRRDWPQWSASARGCPRTGARGPLLGRLSPRARLRAVAVPPTSVGITARGGGRARTRKSPNVAARCAGQATASRFTSPRPSSARASRSSCPRRRRRRSRKGAAPSRRLRRTASRSSSPPAHRRPGRDRAVGRCSARACAPRSARRAQSAHRPRRSVDAAGRHPVPAVGVPPSRVRGPEQVTLVARVARRRSSTLASCSMLLE